MMKKRLKAQKQILYFMLWLLKLNNRVSPESSIDYMSFSKFLNSFYNNTLDSCYILRLNIERDREIFY